MEMSWDKLADRCQLFVDTNKGMLIELLKEAEQELVRECLLNEDTATYDGSLHTNSDFIVLPANFLSVIGVYYNGDLLMPMADDGIDLDTSNALKSGTPSRYFIQKHADGGLLKFDRTPTSGDIRIDYKSSIYYRRNKKFRNLELGTIVDSGGGDDIAPIRIATELGDALIGLKGSIVKNENWGGSSSTATSFTILSHTASTSSSEDAGQQYVVDVPDSASGTIPVGAVIKIFRYNVVAPSIPIQYHRDLCDYAIAIASAKANPELHNKHMAIWLNNIQKIINEDADKELIHTMRREI